MRKKWITSRIALRQTADEDCQIVKVLASCAWLLTAICYSLKFEMLWNFYCLPSCQPSPTIFARRFTWSFKHFLIGWSFTSAGTYGLRPLLAAGWADFAPPAGPDLAESSSAALLTPLTEAMCSEGLPMWWVILNGRSCCGNKHGLLVLEMAAG